MVAERGLGGACAWETLALRLDSMCRGAFMNNRAVARAPGLDTTGLRLFATKNWSWS